MLLVNLLPMSLVAQEGRDPEGEVRPDREEQDRRQRVRELARVRIVHRARQARSNSHP